MAYATDAVVLDISSKFQALITADSAIVARVSASHADPVVNAKLHGRGAPFTTAPALIVLIASMLTAHWMWANKLSQSDDMSKLAAEWKKYALQMLDDIAMGVLGLDDVSNVDSTVFGELNPEWQEDAIFVGDELDWLARVETRDDD